MGPEKRSLAHSAVWTKKYEFLGDSTVILITGHRRENFGDGFQSIFKAIKKLADAFLSLNLFSQFISIQMYKNP